MDTINRLQTLLKANRILWVYEGSEVNDSMLSEWIQDWRSELIEEAKTITNQEFKNLDQDTRAKLEDLRAEEKEKEANKKSVENALNEELQENLKTKDYEGARMVINALEDLEDDIALEEWNDKHNMLDYLGLEDLIN